jgi:hypothetical protein
MRAWKKWRGVKKGTKDGSWRKTSGGREGRREIMNSLLGGRLMWKGVGHMENDKWMMRREVTTRTKGWRWTGDTRQQEKGGSGR